jgi:hypothetical protein
MRRVAAIVAGILCLGAAALLAGGQVETDATSGHERRVHITANDTRGNPATDLAPTEVRLREDGQLRTVVSVGPSDDLMQVVLLVDDTGPGIQHIRQGVADFVRVLQQHAEFALVSTGGRNTLLTDFTRDLDEIGAAINRLMTRTTSGAYLLDAIVESARTLEVREARRPVIVVVALEGSEFSNVQGARVIEAVRRSGAILHVVAIGKPTLKTMTPWNQRPTESIHQNLDENITRTNVFGNGTRLSGGRLEQVVEFTGVPNRLTEIARDLRDQLVVTYVRPPTPTGPTRLDVSVTRRGVRLRAPRQVSDR